MIGANRFYQEYIKNKDHIHLNSTRWKFLVNVITFMREEKLLNVVESNGVNDEQFHIGYIDNSPEGKKRRLREQMGRTSYDEERIENDLGPSMELQIQRAEELKAQMETEKQPKVVSKPPKAKTKLSFGLKSKLNTKASSSLKGGIAKSTGLN